MSATDQGQALQHYSPDGRFWWDGQQWVPTASAVPQQQQPMYAAAPAYGYPPYPMVQVAAKSPAIAVLASFFVPGLGSIVSGSPEVGTAILVCWLISFPLIILFGLGILTGLLCWIIGMIHGYTAAQNWNAKHGIIS